MSGEMNRNRDKPWEIPSQGDDPNRNFQSPSRRRGSPFTGSGRPPGLQTGPMEYLAGLNVYGTPGYRPESQQQGSFNPNPSEQRGQAGYGLEARKEHAAQEPLSKRDKQWKQREQDRKLALEQRLEQLPSKELKDQERKRWLENEEQLKLKRDQRRIMQKRRMDQQRQQRQAGNEFEARAAQPPYPPLEQPLGPPYPPLGQHHPLGPPYPPLEQSPRLGREQREQRLLHMMQQSREQPEQQDQEQHLAQLNLERRRQEALVQERAQQERREQE